MIHREHAPRLGARTSRSDDSAVDATSSARASTPAAGAAEIAA